MACMHNTKTSLFAFTVVNLCFGLTHSSTAPTNRFRGGGEAVPQTVTTQEVQSSLQVSLESALRGDGNAALQLSRIEASLWQTFQALPKNSMGRLAPRAVRYAVHNYFAKEHGWQIKGLEPEGMQSNATEVHEMTILQDKAPALVEALLETRRSDLGLPLSDVVAMVAALERLIFDESFKLLEASYELNGLSVNEKIDERALHDVLTSYLLVFELGFKGNLSDSQGHHKMKRILSSASGSWQNLVEFEQDAALNFGYARSLQTNPFLPQRYSFEAAAQIVEDMAQSYGKWQNAECRQMKEELMSLDPNGLGRVPLSAFYGQPENAAYQLTESIEYLQQVGALDESSHSTPMVLIANYMAGPSNCIASSTYYSVCCLSECEGLMNDLEGKVQAPSASPERLLRLVGNLSSSTIDARELPEILAEKLRAIGERHGGEVPLHGRLFAQWLHHAFPNECPYPQITENTAALTPSHWHDKKSSAPKEERQQHIDAASGAAKPVIELSNLQWSDDEVLPLIEPRSRSQSSFGTAMRLGMQVALVFVVLRVAFAAWKSAVHGPSVAKKDKEFELPF